MASSGLTPSPGLVRNATAEFSVPSAVAFDLLSQLAIDVVFPKHSAPYHYLMFLLSFVDHPVYGLPPVSLLVIQAYLRADAGSRAQFAHFFLDLDHHIHVFSWTHVKHL